MPLMSIDRVNKVGDIFSSLFFSKGEHGFCLEIECKDMRLLRFSFVPHTSARGRVLAWLQGSIPPSTRIFANQFSEGMNMVNKLYYAYHPIKEYSRLGIWKNSGP